MAAELFNHVNI